MEYKELYERGQPKRSEIIRLGWIKFDIKGAKMRGILIFLFCVFVLSASDHNETQKFMQAVEAFNKGECESAERIYKELADAGYPDALFNYGWMKEKGQCARQDIKGALELYERAVKSQKPKVRGLASYRLGLLYMTGRGTAQDVGRAKQLWQLSDSLEYPQAALSLGLYYLQGINEPKNEKEARRYFTRACDAGLQPACELIKNLTTP